MVKLSKRLQTIAGYVPDGVKLADIGSDHALLPVYLAERGRVSFAVAGEINAGPRDAAQKQVKEAGLSSVISVRLGDGLAVIEPNEIDVVTIAGMGGSLISHILEEGRSKLAGVSKLILQPNVGEDQMRRWLLASHWVLEDETVLEEDGKYYEVLCAGRSPDAIEINRAMYGSKRLDGGLTLDSDELLRYGPILTSRANEAFFRKWESELEKLDKITEGMSRGGTEAAIQRQSELLAERNRIREVMDCLLKVKR
ncbi:tRNA (adenine-N(1))-methyltransferase [Paenibacillus mesophilus]|uniref:tRNA (adenine(22)-N(1))-methyltransferase n=1 Tax=Paenibacillus mesophilus TaxID=2582849 RepID=UPI00110E0B00|nr:tRNA (adenine(22)-N(1))-methyltransferase TrmK [Paenibacillus mesophilus]TMV44597.1 tRNA (adenine-N(1))-methyltransferase [Paenibacillus mesophilus]